MATFTVTSTADAGPGSLRQAIDDANASPTPDTIDFSALFSTPQSITLSSGVLTLTDAATTTITGTLAGVTVNGNNASGVFKVDTGASAVLSNLTITGGNAYQGGGLWNNSGFVTITDSAVINNSATFAGGLDNVGGTMSLTNVTLSGNTATNNGGAIDNVGATLTMTNVTISGNTAGEGGGLRDNGTTNIQNTIIAGNTAPSSPDVWGTIGSQGYNLIGKTDGSSGWVGSDLTGTVASPLNAQLGTPANNGGPTDTMALLDNSPAIGAGNSATAPATDQRGLPRSGNTDIGAYEYQFEVTTTADSGAGSLRQAIITANAAAGADTVVFRIGTGAQTIAPASALPTITDAMVIDATTQPGYAGTPLIELDGSNIVAPTNGLQINAANSIVRGLSIVDWSFAGIIVNSDNVRIQSNYIGVRADGSSAGNASGGVWIYIGDNNIIGTDGDGVNDASEGNVISGNTSAGVYLQDGSENNTIAGNIIGLNAAGTAALGTQQYGLWLFNDAVDLTVIGTDGDGVSDALERNIISGNTDYGVRIDGADNSIIAGNLIGTNSAGTSMISSAQSGISLGAGTTGTRVGTNADSTSDTLERNVIVGGTGNLSGNNFGIALSGAGTTLNTVAGNYVGVGASGSTAMANAIGILIAGGASTNTIGGISTAARNIISGNTSTGVTVTDVGTTGNVLRGNYIGTDSTGTADLGNGSVGIAVNDASGNTVGGTTAGARNVISGNQDYGISLAGAAGSNTVAGNYIGLNAAGDAAIANHIGIQSSATLVNTIGDTDEDGRNVISGNTNYGIALIADAQVIQGNWIGLNAAGTAAVSNGLAGILINGNDDNVIGGTAAGAGNVISGNDDTSNGIWITNGGDGNIIQGNLIGTNPAGTAAIGNSYGISIDGGATNNIVGGTTAAARNVISGSTGSGIQIAGAGTTGNTVLGNYIGTDITGLLDRGNSTGIHIVSAVGTTIGGAIADAGNVISGNETGVLVESLTADPTSTLIAGNYIGVDATGAGALGNEFDGIDIRTGGNTIGGTDTLARNVIAGHSQRGIVINGANAVGNVVLGNYIGTDVTGSGAIANSEGVRVSGGATGTIIGGATIVPGTGAGNVISGNVIGVNVFNATTIQGNLIGLTADGTAALGNTTYGVSSYSGTGGNLIGGAGAGEGNIISGNSEGVIVAGPSTGDRILGNRIGTNALGTAAVPNAYGVHLFDTSSAIVGEPGAGNLISGNSGAGIYLNTGGGVTSNHLIQANLIGTNAAGTATIANLVGVQLDAGSTNNTIGGSTPAQRNIISGNSSFGVSITGASTTNNTISGNYVGLDSTGDGVLGNGGSGIDIGDSPGNTIGGGTPGHRNVISGNSRGIVLVGANTYDTLVVNNYIGTDATGLLDRGNAIEGIRIQGGSNTNYISGNVISGNNDEGVGIYDSGSDANELWANIIGLGSDGSTIIGNLEGISLNGVNNTIIGGDAGASDRNIVSGNTLDGIIVNFGAADTIIYGNYLGTDITGTLGRGNGNTGVIIANGSTGTLVGGSSPGQGNLISGNGFGGSVSILGATGTIVQGNLIGTNAAGTAAIGNHMGVSIQGTSTGNLIGGSTAAERNIISSNGIGVFVSGSGATANKVQGNYIGTTQSGAGAISNDRGVVIDGGASANFIGTDGDGTNDETEGNVISGNTTGGYGFGVQLSDADNNVVAGNRIGVNAAGTAALPNLEGVFVNFGSTGNKIGTDGNSTSDTLERNIISGNTNRGVRIEGAGTSNNTVAGNYIGTNAAGTAPVANDRGVDIGFTATGNTIGGHVSGAGNLISGNTNQGIAISANSNTVQGNIIGLNAAGTGAVPNARGVDVSASSVLIGTDGDGVNDANERNVISGNTNFGVILIGGGNNRVAGNYIGTRADGIGGSVANSAGVFLQSTTGNIIGTDGSNDAFNANERNVISGNAFGIELIDSGVSGNTISGNYIGTDKDGANAIANGIGIRLSNGPQNNIIGGTTAAASNVISGNAGSGVYLTGTGTSNNTILGNYIGTDVSGQVDLGNTGNGILVSAGSSGNTIGGSAVASRNVISGNNGNGIELNDSDNNVIIGNFIGLNSLGTARVGNTLNGVFVQNTSSGNRIGTDGNGVNDSGERNVISGNASSPNANVNIIGAGTSGNIVAGNYVGTTADGLSTVANAGRGIRIAVGATGNRIGTDGSNDSFNASERNIVAGHAVIGIFVVGGSNNNVVAGNYVGLNATGTSVLGNSADGITLDGVSGVRIGTNADGIADELEANVIAGSGGWGMLVSNGSTLNTVAGNRIGTNAAGTSVMPNAFGGLLMGANSTFNTIGGTVVGAGNLISGNAGPGVSIVRTYLGVTYPASPNNTVAGNLIGTDVTGTLDFGNSGPGIRVEEPNTTIGGITVAARNVISGNAAEGVLITGVTATNVQVLGNYIGTNTAGTTAIPNATGVSLAAGASNNTIGGTTVGARNVISGNAGTGVSVTGAGTDNNTIFGNYIGTNVDGTAAQGNGTEGIFINNGASNTTIGGLVAGAGNVISGNDLRGIGIRLSSDTTVQGNLIGTDAAGTSAIGNGTNGIWIGDATNTLIGGNTAAARNIISGTTEIGSWFDDGNGIGISGASLGTIILGNYIGTDISGTIALPNADAGIGSSDAVGVIIGGSGTGDGNLISGNAHDGILLHSVDAFIIQGNRIGTDADGTGPLANGEYGIRIGSGSNITIGGPSSWSGGTLSGAGNLISGNAQAGIVNGFGFTPTNTIIRGNAFGTDITGTAALLIGGNGGIVNQGTGSIIGGTGVGEGNLISGLTFGISAGTGSTILGNFIGTNFDGTAAIGNGTGIVVVNGNNNTIGGTAPGARNIVSGNSIGIDIYSSSNSVVGNYIGTNNAGTAAIGNGTGVQITGGATNNTIGGTTAAARNVISGNTQDGVSIQANSTSVQGNYIGTDASGQFAIGNGRDGINANTLSSQIHSNVISGNLRHGMDIGGELNTISGNFIGTNATGTAAIQNASHGIASYSNNSIIGGFTPAERNIIVAAYAGVSLNQSSNTRISGNYIGTDVTGTQVLASGNPTGISMFGHPAASNITIGGGEPGAGNVINLGTIGNGVGIHIQHVGGSGNKVQGNFIGTDPTGSFRVGNNWGVLVDWQNGVVIGTDSDGSAYDATEGNVISGNVNGIVFGGFGGGGITGTVIAGNKIGADKTGTQVIGNTNDGMQLNSYGSTRVGTDSNGVNDANEGNIIAGSGRAGIWFSGDNNVIAGNFIGTDTTETIALPNTYGIIAAAGTGHTIGGAAAIARNVIANSSLTGLKLEPGTSNTGSFVNNSYFGSLFLAIDAGASGRTLNDASGADGVLDYPEITSAQIVGNEMIVTGTMPVGKTVELYISAPAGNGVGQGRTRLASVLDDSAADENLNAGFFRIRVPLGNTVTHGTPLTALTVGSISEFSPVVLAGDAGSSLAPQITLGQSAVSISNGDSIDVRGSFYDPDSVSWTATVDYGDGSGVKPLDLNADQSFDLKHTYVNPGNYTVTVRLTDNSLVSSTRTLNVSVANEAPTATFNTFTITSPASEGQLVSLVGQFEDSSGTYTATIEWGDGQTSVVTQALTSAGQIVPLGAGKYEIRATHVYLDDSNGTGSATPADVYRVLVTVSDNSGGTDTTPIGLFLEEVRNVIPHSLNVGLSSTAISEGQAVSLSGSFIDPGVLDVHKVRVNWGDGTESLITLPVGARSFAGQPELTHVYTDDQALGADEYVITVTVEDDDQPESPVTLTRTISVANALPLALNPVLNAAVINENGLVTLSGSFFDPGILDTHTVSVDWGDGSSQTSLSLAEGASSFSGLTHQYLDNPAVGSTFQITVRVSDNDSPDQFATVTRTVTVNNVAPTVGALTLSSGGHPIREGEWLTISGSYDDLSDKDRHEVRIYWGDGLSSLASVNSTTRTFTASHQYGDNGTPESILIAPNPVPVVRYLSQIQIVVTDDEGLAGSQVVTQEVNNVAPEVTVTPDAGNSDPALIKLNALATDAGYLDTLNVVWQAWPVDAPSWVQSFTQSSTVAGSLFSSFSIDRRLHPHYSSANPNVFPAVVWKIVATTTDDEGGSFAYETAMLVGTSGNDNLVINDNTFTSAGVTSLIVLGLDGSDIIDGTNVQSSIHQLILDGGAGQDFLYGGPGDDVYYLRRGNDVANVGGSGSPFSVVVVNPDGTTTTIPAGAPVTVNTGGNDRYVLTPNSTLTVVDPIGNNVLDFGLADFGDASGIQFDLSLNQSTSLVAQDVSVTQPSLHYVQTMGSFTGLTGSRFGDLLTGASASTIDGGAGDDQFMVKANTSGATFVGGADDDLLTVSGTNITSLNFGGDDGTDQLVNLGTITGLTFNGGADDDLLLNTGTILSTLNFGGDDGVDSLFNSGSITSLTFGGGADDDLLQNTGTILSTLNFGGDDGADVLLNAGSIASLTFNGGADDDIFVNNGAVPTTLNFGGDDDLLLTGTGTIGTLNFGGDDGADIFVNLSTITSLTFNGGADDDIFINNGTVPTSLNFGGDDDALLSGQGTIATLNFGGDDGSDTLINAGSISSLTFGGGADDDLLQNTGTILSTLNFGGDDGADVLLNAGSIASLTFNGGADDDIFVNNGAVPTTLNFGGNDDLLLTGTGTIGTLNFGGDDGADIFVNLSMITTLTFNGGADDDILINNGTVPTSLNFGGDDDALLSGQGTITTLNFGGDEGSDTLQNFGTVTSLTFGGGADDDLLINTGTVIGTLNFGGDDDILVSSGGGVATLNFGGDEGSDTLLNLGSVGTLTFGGGADDDLLQNTGTVLVSLNFGGDDGSDILFNWGNVATLTFGGGADDDLLINSGSIGMSLNFGGDDGSDQLQNSGTINSLTFNGGADDDLLINVGTGTITTLNFGGDDGSDTLQNLGTMTSLTFGGGADDDLLVNSGTVLTSLNFGGDDGADVLLNRGSVTSLTFGGGADDDILFNSGSVTSLTFNGGADDDVLLNNGNNITTLNFGGDDGIDVLVNNGSSIVSLTFNGGADDDLLISTGQNITTLSFSGDSGTRVPGRTSDDTLIVRGSGSGTAASAILFDGGYGIDAFENNAVGFATITFQGGLDDDALLNNAPGLASLNFGGDDGSDVFVNRGGAIVSLTFNGGADDDIFVNGGTGIVTLTFNGGADDDLLINSGNQLATLNFGGDDGSDQLVNQGNQIVSLTFNGGADDDLLINDGSFVTTLNFGGDAGNDRLWNRKTGVGITAIEFTGDDGADVLINDAAEIVSLNFGGDDGADVLQNNGSVATLTFGGGADDDIFVNAGSIASLTFNGGADDDILLNRGTEITTLNFGGDEGSDTLFNLGAVTSLTFNGGADDDVLQNSGSVVTLNFGGDDGSDLLVNNASVRTLTFGGGADDDTLQNNASVVSLTFNGGADDDLLVNNGNNISTLNFGGDDGTDTLINNGSSIASLTFNGGADGDTLRIHGRNIGSVDFEGGEGSDSFSYNGTGTASSVVTFSGSGGNDFFAIRGVAGVVQFDGGQGDDSVMIVGSGAMLMTGGAGDDMYRFVNNPLADITLLDGFSGATDNSQDTLDFSSFSGGAVNLDLRLVNVWQPQGNGQLRVMLTDGMAVENVIGSSFADTIYGNARSNYIGGADFDEAFTGPVAAPRGVTQWVFLDFVTNTNTGTVDPITGLPDLGEYVYSLTEQEQIRQRVESVYRGPNAGAPWFDIRVVTDLTEIPSTIRSSSQFATVFFNRTPDFGRPGGLASEIDPGNANLGGFAVVQVNGLLGGVITGVDAKDGHIEDESSIAGYKGDHAEINDVEVGAIKPAATSDNFVRLSSKVAAHELGHLLGLRHQDSFGPIGSGLHDPPGAGAYKPVYTGPSGGVETFDHIIGSPASVGSTRFDDLNDLFFGEREAIKLAFANSDPAATTRNESTVLHNTQASAEPMVPVTLAVPNTLSRGLNQPKDFFVQLGAINGSIELGANGRSQSDWYSFTGRKGELINIDVFSNSLARYATGSNGALRSGDFVDTIVRVYDGSGNLVPYYNGVAVNDDMFEPTDSSLVDLLLPADGTYFIEVDSFHRFGDPLGDPLNPVSPLNPNNPNNILSDSERVARFIDSINDTDTGRYQLIMYKFRKASSSDGIDDLKGNGGVDTIVGGPGDDYKLDFSLGSAVTGVNEASSLSRAVTISDRGASEWTGSTVNYGDGSGNQPLFVSPTGQFTLNHTWADNGSYTVTVTIVNNVGQSLTKQLLVTVDNVAPAPSIPTISSPRVEGTAISVTGSATDAASTNDTLTFAWAVYKDGASTAFATAGNSTNFNFTPNDNGSYRIVLTVNDEDGGTASVDSTISVGNLNPTAAFSNAGNIRPSQTASVTFSNSSDPSPEDMAAAFQYFYDFDNDGTFDLTSTASTVNVPTSYTATAGTKTVRGHIVDKDGGLTEYFTQFDVFQVISTSSVTVNVIRPLYGVENVVLTATIASAVSGGPTPTGTVSFYNGTTLLGTASLNTMGVASLDVGSTTLEAGVQAVRVEYSGDAEYLSSQDQTTVEVLAPSMVQGLVYLDLDNDGQVDLGENGIAGVTLTLTGTDDRGNSVSRTVQTDSNGVYFFSNLRPSNGAGYSLTQSQPTGYVDGVETLGFIGGTPVGTIAGNDAFSGLVLTSGGLLGENYNFAERPASNGGGGAIQRGETAGIGFWQNKNGQNLILELNGGASATQLGNWLAATFPQIYGSLAGKTNSQVAAFYKQLFALNGKTAPGGPPKLDAQVMATALAVYVTKSSLGGNTATSYGFNVTTHGVGTKTINVTNRGAAFGIADNSTVTILDLLLTANSRAHNGLLFDINGNGSLSAAEINLRVLANSLFDEINQLGGI